LSSETLRIETNWNQETGIRIVMNVE